MRGRMVTALLFVAMLSVFAADITVGCGQQEYVYGTVTQKYATGGDTGDYVIAVNGETHTVPLTFYQQVQIGDTVRFDGKDWSIVKPGSTTAPAGTTSP